MINSFLIYRSHTETDHRTFQRDIALRLLRIPLSYARKQLTNIITTGQRPIEVPKAHHEYIKMNRGYCKGRKGCGATSQPRGKKDFLKDININTVGRRPGRTVWGCKQCAVNYCKIRDYWLALPGYIDSAITGANGAFSLVQKEDKKGPVESSNLSVSTTTNLRKSQASGLIVHASPTGLQHLLPSQALAVPY